MSAPYDPFPAITALTTLLASAGGQEALLRFLGQRGVTTAQLQELANKLPIAEPPFLPPEDEK